jgi:hypothetical protein
MLCYVISLFDDLYYRLYWVSMDYVACQLDCGGNKDKI